MLRGPALRLAGGRAGGSAEGRQWAGLLGAEGSVRISAGPRGASWMGAEGGKRLFGFGPAALLAASLQAGLEGPLAAFPPTGAEHPPTRLLWVSSRMISPGQSRGCDPLRSPLTDAVLGFQ